MVTLNITEHLVLGHAVSGREVYGLVNNSKSTKDRFSDWFRAKQKLLLLEEGKDFIQIKSKVSASHNHVSLEFVLTISAAKRVAGAQLAGRGNGVVNFLREYERRLAAGITNELPQRSTESSLKTTPSLTGMSTAPADLSKEVSVRIGTEPQSLGQIIETTQQTLFPLAEPSVDNKPLLTPLQKILQQAQEVANKEAEAYNQKEEIARLREQVEAFVRCGTTIANLFRQAAIAILSELPVGELPNEPIADEQFDDGALSIGSTNGVDLGNNSTRSKLVQLVNRYSEAKHVEQKSLWRFLYGQLNEVHHFSVSRHRTNSKEPYIDVVERSGHLDNLYAIANARLLTPVAAQAQS